MICNRHAYQNLIVFVILAFALATSGFARIWTTEAQVSDATVQAYDTSEVDVVPEMIGGSRSFADLINKNSLYPSKAQDEGVSGRVILDFVVDEEGHVAEVKVVREEPQHYNFGKIAKSALKTMAFVPGTLDGKRVHVKMSQTVMFLLRTDEPADSLPPQEPNR